MAPVMHFKKYNAPIADYRSDGTIINLVGNSNFETNIVIKERQTYFNALLGIKLLHIIVFAKKVAL